MPAISRILIVVSVLFFISPAHAQITNVTDTTSTPTPGLGHDYINMLDETVNPANGSISLRISVPVPPGRKLTLPFSFAYDSNGVHHFVPVGSGFAWLSDKGFLAQGGWTYAVPMMSAGTGQSVFSPDNGQTTYTCDFTTDYMFQDASGGRHPLSLSYILDDYGQCGQFPSPPQQYLSGGDDFFSAALDSASRDLTVRSADGTVYSIPWANQQESGGNPNSNIFYGLPPKIEDRNGNIATITDNGHGAFTMTDTAGRIAVSSSGFGASGNTVAVSGLSNPYVLTWGSSSTNFAPSYNVVHADLPCSGPPSDTETEPVVTAITLPNGKQYQFFYDGTYGLLNKVVYPTGGYVSYSWGFDPLSQGSNFLLYGSQGSYGCDLTYDTPAVVHRYVSFDGSTVALQQDFNYSTNYPAGSTLWTTKQTTVTTHDLVRGTNWQTIYNYVPIYGPLQANDPITDSIQMPLEQTTTYKDTNGSTLRTVTKAWFDLNLIGCELTALDNGQITGTWYAYGPGAQLTDRKVYDYGLVSSASTCQNNSNTVPPPSNVTPTRETVIAYQPFSNIFDRPSSVKTYGNGNLAGETDYSYDQGAVGSASTPSGTHDETNYGASSNTPRGNPTSVTKQCFPGCVNAVTTYTYDETGQALTMKDPCGNSTCGDMGGAASHTTNYSYGDSYASCGGSAPSGNTNAYLTTVTDPLGHSHSFCYGYNDGQLRSSTDPNHQTTLYKYNDSLARLTETDNPDGGTAIITYNDAPPSPTVTTSKPIASGVSLTSVAVMDGLGHVVQNQITSDPDGSVYTDVTYDGTGRVWKRSNPHRSTGLSSDGTTTNYFDALGRPCLVVPPDGTLPSGTPCSTQPSNTIFTSYAGNTVTVTDQAGNSRRSISDGLGRLIEVDEPGSTSPASPSTGSASVGGSEQIVGGTAGTSGTGSVSVSGTLQSKQVQTQPGAAGTGSINLAGSEQSTPGTHGTGWFSITGTERVMFLGSYYYDHGTVTVTVNGSSVSTTYGKGDTYAAIATRLANNINGNGTYPVTAVASGGSTVYITAKAVGTNTNYSLSASSVTTFGPLFSGTSFPIATSGSALTGGQNLMFDSGTIAVTVNGFRAPYTYGQSDTPSSIASGLANALSASSVNASVNGAMITLTAKTIGAATNYSLSTSVSYYFPTPSFTATPSGSTLTGGRDAVYNTIYDSGTTTITTNNHPNTVTWNGSGTTTASIASSLAANINADSAAFVTASASANNITLTAKIIGASTNYSLSCSSTYDSSNFTNASFATSNSGATLTGGSNGTATVYDSGSVWISVAGFQANASYGQNDTASSVAIALANGLNAPTSPIVASASGSTVSLSSKAQGANTNYSLSSGSSTSQPTSFSQPSFSISVPATLTGGTNAVLSLSTPAVTTYNYDPLNNLISVVQSSSRQRSFSYDSLSQLVCASNPEDSFASCPAGASGYTSGTTGYTYDPNGNISTKTASAPNQPAAATVTATFTYDALNRLTQKSFSDGTPSVKYGYDAVAPPGCSLPFLTIDNGIGKRTGMCDAAGAEAWSYDIVSGTGWKATDVRTTNNVTLTTVEQNNLDGSINSITYPSGHTVSYRSGGAGRPLSATDNTANISYVSSAQYWPSGALSALTNGGSISFNTILNSRLQPCWIYGTTASALPWNTTPCSGNAITGNILDLKYNYNLGSADNGNVVGVNNNRDTTRSQTFGYDPLNRLISAQTVSTYSTSPSNCWSEVFGYDSWGNLLFNSPSSSTTYIGCTQEQPQAWALNAKNQIQNSTTCFDNSGNLLTVATYCYDAAGNLLTNTAISFAYDAENRLKSLPMLGISYLYDGDGRRVAKVNSSGQATKLYWYGTGGDPLDETDGTGAANNSFFEYVFFNGKRFARRDASNNVSYYFADHLGTARIVTNSGGTILDDSDFYPFGGERPIVSSSGNAYKFTGKERDSESGLDDFDARYYGSSIGRFMSPDWSDTAEAVPYADLTNPQTLNLYAYVKNNPLRDTDPTGHAGDDDLVDHILNFVVSAGATWLSDNAFGFFRPNPQSPEGQLGQSLGDFGAQQSGIAEAEAGAADRGGALVLAVSGQEEAAAPAAALSQAMIVHGATTSAIGTVNLAKDAAQTSSTGNRPYENTPDNRAKMDKGKPPTGKDGYPAELHHEGQEPNGKSTEMTRTEHRLGENFKKNHANTGQSPSKINRAEARKQRNKHWKNRGQELKAEQP